jgi:hypothetical protein
MKRLLCPYGVHHSSPSYPHPLVPPISLPLRRLRATGHQASSGGRANRWRRSAAPAARRRPSDPASLVSTWTHSEEALSIPSSSSFLPTLSSSLNHSSNRQLANAATVCVGVKPPGQGGKDVVRAPVLEGSHRRLHVAHCRATLHCPFHTAPLANLQRSSTKCRTSSPSRPTPYAGSRNVLHTHFPPLFLHIPYMASDLAMARGGRQWLGKPLGMAALLMVYFGTPNMFTTLWFALDYETNPPLGTLMI